MISLDSYGWNDFHQRNYIQHLKNDLSVGRIISIKGFKYYLITEQGEIETELSGKLLYATSPEELPKVGDWVLFKAYDSLGYIIEVLPRMNELSRKNPGEKIQRQILGVNIDYALIVQGLDRDFNLMRLERYLVQLTSCGIQSIVILNKADLIDDQNSYVEEIQKLQRDCRVHFCSTYTGLGIEVLRNKILEKSKTYILIGSSGVGKSSLLNILMSSEVQKTGEGSESTSKGKHTTTTRDLFQLPNGSLLIDSPGMREFGLTSDDGATQDDLFPAIQKFSTDCRFANCTHINEPYCAVIKAVELKLLEESVYSSYLKLIKEQQRFEIKAEDKKRMGKQSGTMSRAANAHRKKYKF
jgi:ribosome biogenesis GTPase